MIRENIIACKESVTDAIIVLKENKSIYRGQNNGNEEILKYKVDGCIYNNTSNVSRCDYLLETTSQLFFIELKGTHIKKGLGQLYTTIGNIKNNFREKTIKARLVSTRGAKPNRLNTYKEYKDLSKLIGVKNIKIKNTPFEENLN